MLLRQQSNVCWRKDGLVPVNTVAVKSYDRTTQAKHTTVFKQSESINDKGGYR